MRILTLIEKTSNGFSAYCPDLPGCIATGDNEQETIENMKQAITFHIEGLKEDGIALPQPQSRSLYIEI